MLRVLSELFESNRPVLYELVVIEFLLYEYLDHAECQGTIRTGSGCDPLRIGCLGRLIAARIDAQYFRSPLSRRHDPLML